MELQVLFDLTDYRHQNRADQSRPEAPGQTIGADDTVFISVTQSPVSTC